MTKLRREDWFFEGDIAATLPDALKEVIGAISKTY